MKIATLPIRQKRFKDWSVFAEKEISDPAIKSACQHKLRSYGDLLVKCFEAAEVSDNQELALLSLERELELLNEEARLSVVPKGNRAH